MSESKILLREDLREGLRKPPRGTLVIKIQSKKGTSQRFLDVLEGPLGDPLGGKFPSRRLSVLLPLILLPLIVLPLNLSPIVNCNRCSDTL